MSQRNRGFEMAGQSAANLPLACRQAYSEWRVAYAPLPSERGYAVDPQDFECGWKYVPSQKPWHLLKLATTRLLDICGDIWLIWLFLLSYWSLWFETSEVDLSDVWVAHTISMLLSISIMFRVAFFRIFSICVDWRVYGALQFEWRPMIEASLLIFQIVYNIEHYNPWYIIIVFSLLVFCEFITVVSHLSYVLCCCFHPIQWILCSCGGPCLKELEGGVPDYPVNQGPNEKPMRYIAKWMVGMTKFGSLRFKLFVLIHYCIHYEEALGFVNLPTMIQETDFSSFPTLEQARFWSKIVINGIIFVLYIIIYWKEFVSFLKWTFGELTCCKCTGYGSDKSNMLIWSDFIMYQVIYTGRSSPIIVTLKNGRKQTINAAEGGGITIKYVAKEQQNVPMVTISTTDGGGTHGTDTQKQPGEQIGVELMVQTLSATLSAPYGQNDEKIKHCKQ